MEKKLKTLAEDAEEDVEFVTEFFMVLREVVKNKFDYELSEGKLNKKTYDALKEHYNSEKFAKPQEMWFIPFGVYSEARDQNAKLREEILKEFSEPHNREKMKEEGKVMVMKISDKEIDGEDVKFGDVYKAVKNPDSLKTTLINDETVVIDGDLWSPGDKIIPRDYRRQIEYANGESYDNNQYSKPLYPNWKVSFIGIGFFAGTRDKKIQDPDTGEIDIIKAPKDILTNGVLCIISWYGDFADPATPSFVAKKPVWFNPCKLKATDSKRSNEIIIQGNARTDIEIIPSKKLNITKIIRYINVRVRNSLIKASNILTNDAEENKLPKEKKAKIKAFLDSGKKYLKKEYIPIIDLIGVDDYHMTHKAIRDPETGLVLKDEGWDKGDFNSIAISECSYSGVYAKEGQPPKMIITDSSLATDVSLFLKFSNGLRSDLPASSVLVCLTTSRGNKIYDKDTGQWIVNEEEAKAIPKIKGIKLLINFGTLDIDSIKKKLASKSLKADV